MRFAWALLIPYIGCAEIDGGAVELAWRIHDARGRSVALDECLSTVGISKVRLRMERDDGTIRADDFDCSDGRGTTRFDVDEGSYLFEIEPVSADGAALGPPDRICVPSPLARDVLRGELTDLEVFLIVTGC